MSTPTTKPSFSPYRRWGIGLHVFLVAVLVLAAVIMVNFLSWDHYVRANISSHPRDPISQRSVNFVQSITNQIKVIVYYDKEEPFFTTVVDLLNDYRQANPKLSVRVVDYLRDPGTAQELQSQYSFLASPAAKNMVIFDCEGRVKFVDGNSLTRYVLEQVPSEKDREYRRRPTAFEGEKAFTAALIAVTNPRPLKAFFLAGHGEHDVDSGDKNVGYSKFASILRQNYIQVEKLSLLGTNSVPMDCNLLVIAGPTTAISEFELQKISQYLDEGGRLLALFNVLSLSRGQTGLEQILARWNVNVSTNIVKDPEHTTSGSDVIVRIFGKHPIVSPIAHLGLHLILPREISKIEPPNKSAESPVIQEIAFSSPNSVTDTNIREKKSRPMILALEKGAIKGVITERGTTRMVITGDSIFLANHQFDSLANRDFATHAANWLLDRTELLEGLGPRPVIEFKLAMSERQLRASRWLLLAAMPGSVLLLGSLVWFRRRK